MGTEHWALSSLQLSQELFVTNNRRQNWNFYHTLPMWIKLKFRYWKMFKLIFIPDFSGMNQSWCSPWSWRKRTRDRPTWPGGRPEWQETVLGGFPALLSDELLDSNNWLAKCSLPCSWQWKLKKGIRLDVIFLSEDSECCFVELLKDFITNKL